MAHDTEVSFLIPDTETVGKLNGMKQAFSLTLKYKKADDWAALKDKELRAFFMGLRSIPNDKGEMIQCGVFVSEGECFLSGQCTLVEAVQNLASRTPVSITYRGRKTNKSNSSHSTMIFDVQLLQ